MINTTVNRKQLWLYVSLQKVAKSLCHTARFRSALLTGGKKLVSWWQHFLGLVKTRLICCVHCLLYFVRVDHFGGSRDGAVMMQWSAATNVARIRFPDSASYVGWVCCWFSSLLRGFFSGFSGFPPSIKTNISKFQFHLLVKRIWLYPYRKCAIKVLNCYYY